MKNDIIELLNNSNLTKQEIKVIKLRFGFYNGIIFTQKAIAEKSHLTPQRIMQIEAKAIKKMRISSIAKSLLPYANNPDNALRNLELFRNNYNKNQIDVEDNSLLSKLRGYTKKQIMDIIKKNFLKKI